MTFEQLVNFAKEKNASDIHVTVGTNLAIRRYGILEMMEPEPTAEQSKAMIYENLTDEQIAKIEAGEDLDFALIMPDGTRMRANIYHQRNNLGACYRLLRGDIPTFEELNIPKVIRDLVNENKGLVLITGPTGSGKTTTLASLVDFVNRKQAKHVITIEDPIEYVYYHAKSMIHQREVGKDVDSFATALRSSLREDPDIILVGEMRDYETMNAAITAAETGHLVFSTLHTSGAAQTIDRIIDTYPAHGHNQVRTQLASILKAVVTQVLVPRVDGSGMAMATEIMLNNEAIANQIREGKTHQIPSTLISSQNLGMHTLNWDLKRLVKEQVITDADARKASSNIKDYEAAR